jgi:16S rRNA G527 N7-methylase RsmG
LGTTSQRDDNGDVSRETSPSQAGTLIRAANWSGLTLEAAQVGRLETFSQWLLEEAIPAGGLGPEEGGRIVDRHVGDALVFAGAWRGEHPGTLLDLGSGVGLPGIPLAIAQPETEVTLVDRSGGRCRLARRAIRVLGLANVQVRETDAARVGGRYDIVTFRAFLPPAKAFGVAAGVLAPGGVAVGGASRTRAPERTAFGDREVEVIAVPAGVLDSPAWLLRMTADYRPRDRESTRA